MKARSEDGQGFHVGIEKTDSARGGVTIGILGR